MSSEKFFFTNGRMFEHNQPIRLKSTLLRDEHGEKYTACYPDKYDLIGYFNMGGKWRVNRIIDKKTHKHYLLKNLKKDYDFKECYSVTRMVGVTMRNFNQNVVTIPRIIESGRTDDGRSYLIEQEVYGVRPTPEVIRKMSDFERDKFCKTIACFLYMLHSKKNGEILSQTAADVEFRDPIAFEDPRYFCKTSYSPVNFSYKTIVHGDLAPRNMLIDLKNNDRISILDWGNAHYDYPFSEFYSMYTNTFTFDEYIVDSISREYTDIREAEVLKEKCVCTHASCREKIHAKPTSSYRLPMSMRKCLDQGFSR